MRTSTFVRPADRAARRATGVARFFGAVLTAAFAAAFAVPSAAQTVALTVPSSPGAGAGTTARPAQDWPTRPVKFIVPFPPGGATDIVGRLAAQKLAERWGQPVVVENRAGASGNIGAEAVARSAPDGHTILVASGSILTVNKHLFPALPFDPLRDFAPISNVASGPMVLVVNNNLPVRSLAEFVAVAREKQGGLTFGSAGVGTQIHLAAELLAATARIEAVHVPYRGAGPALVDVANGQIHFMTDNLASSLPLVNQGRVRAIAVTSRERSRLLPDVPSLAEQGLGGFEANGWFGLVAPAATPREIIERIHADLVRAVDSTDVRARLQAQGLDVVANTPEQFRRAIAMESRRWARVVDERRLAAAQ